MAAALDKRLVKILRRLSSDYDGEVLAAVSKLKKLCAAEGVSLNDLVVSIGAGETSEMKYTEADAVTIFERGKEVGRAETADEETEFFDIDGNPNWYAIAVFNRDNVEQLKNAWMRDFTVDVIDRILAREPSPKQARWLLQIFVKLGGHCDPKIKARYF